MNNATIRQQKNAMKAFLKPLQKSLLISQMKTKRKMKSVVSNVAQMIMSKKHRESKI